MLQQITNAATSAAQAQTEYIERPEPKVIAIPAERWEEMSKINSCMILSETKPGVTANVRSTQYEGFLYTAFSTCHGGLHKGSIITAWMLVPEKMYQGQVFTDMNWDADGSPRIRRGDYTGFRVKVMGQPMICVKEVHFLRTLPSVKPLTLEEAKSIDSESRNFGWRSMSYGKDASISWHTLSGHPVAVYTRGHERTGVLLWRAGKKSHDLVLGEDRYFDMLDAVGVSIAADPTPTRGAMQQASLF